jgi:hypothetical protein
MVVVHSQVFGYGSNHLASVLLLLGALFPGLLLHRFMHGSIGWIWVPPCRCISQENILCSLEIHLPSSERADVGAVPKLGLLRGCHFQD